MMFGRMERVIMRNLGMMSRFFMTAGLTVLGSFPMMFGGLFVDGAPPSHGDGEYRPFATPGLHRCASFADDQ